MTEKPNIYYSEPYYVKDKKAAWKVDKFIGEHKNQTMDFWSEKLAWEWLETINIYITNK